MMIRRLSALGTLLSLALLPVSAQAYVTPEETLDEESNSTYFYEEPPTTRGTQAAFEEQQRISAERREAELKAAMPQPEPEPEELHGAAPEEEQSDIDKMIELIKLLQSENAGNEPEPETPGSSLDPVTQRLLLRIEAQRDAAERASFIESLLGENETLHSGAPLSETGPATVLVVLAVAGAVAETWRRVRKTERVM